MHRPLTDSSRALAAELGEALRAAGYTHDGVRTLLGPMASAALERDETTPGLRVTRGRSPLETLVRLWPLQSPVPLSEVEAALPGMVDRLCVEGILATSVGEVVARVDVSPYAETGADGREHGWLLVSDLTPGMDGSPNRMRADYVLGVSAASISLAQITTRDRVASALDVGTGSGLQALHASTHADHVVATDVNTRALWLTDFTAAMNGVESIEVREGSWFGPVAGERFDLVVSNPPFVISPATGEQLVYRDSGLPGDRAVEQMVRTAPRHLTVGGRCHLLADWVVQRGVPWEERLGAMVEASGCHALVVQRELMDPAAYVELWLKDSGHHGGEDYVQRYDTWLSWFEDQGVEAIGFGWINLQRVDDAPGAPSPQVRLEEWPHAVEQPVAPAYAAWIDAVTGLAGMSDEDLLAARPVRRPDVVQETHGAPGAADPETIVLRQQVLLRRARTADTVVAALVGACDGELSVGQILDALASLTETDPLALRAAHLPQVRDLVTEDYLRLV
ncbi:methyltransferase [Nocardioidaceae bacterium]|nr:methyltransferase [Nocardioidaceae bacterium]